MTMDSRQSGLERIWIAPEGIRFYREEGGGVAADWSSRRGPVLVRRLFPLSAPSSAIWIGDRSGREWGLLPALEGLDPESRTVLVDELRLSPFLPRIGRVISLQRRFGDFRWTVESDAGELSFLTGPLYESVSELPGGERVVVDLDEQRYLLREDRRVDRSTRKKLAKWL